MSYRRRRIVVYRPRRRYVRPTIITVPTVALPTVPDYTLLFAFGVGAAIGYILGRK